MMGIIRTYHRAEQQADLLKRVSECCQPHIVLKAVVVEYRGESNTRFLELTNNVVKAEKFLIQPSLKVKASRYIRLELLVVNDAAFNSIDEEHLSRLQAALVLYIRGINENSANLGSTNDPVVVCLVETARAKAVTVQVGTAISAVRKGEQSRAIPWFHQAGSPFVEGSLRWIHASIVLPGFRHHKHDCLW